MQNKRHPIKVWGEQFFDGRNKFEKETKWSAPSLKAIAMYQAMLRCWWWISRSGSQKFCRPDALISWRPTSFTHLASTKPQSACDLYDLHSPFAFQRAATTTNASAKKQQVNQANSHSRGRLLSSLCIRVTGGDNGGRCFSSVVRRSRAWQGDRAPIRVFRSQNIVFVCLYQLLILLFADVVLIVHPQKNQGQKANNTEHRKS